MPNTILGRLPAIIVEYASRGQRVQRLFQNALAARRFYIAKFNTNRNPKVLKE